jgi:hypothetical protein
MEPPLRWRSTRQPPGGFGLTPFHIQVGEDLLDDVRILDARDDSHHTAAGRADLDVDIPNTRLRSCAQVIAEQRFAGVRFRQDVNMLGCLAQLPVLAICRRDATNPW